MLNETQIEKYLYKYMARHEEFIQDVEHITSVRIEANDHITGVNRPFSMEEAFKRTQDLNKIALAESSMKSEQVSMLGTDLMSVAHSVYGDSKNLYANPVRFGQNVELVANVRKSVDAAKFRLLELINKPVFLLNRRRYTPSEMYTVAVQDALLNKPQLGNLKSMRRATSRLTRAQNTFESILSFDRFERVISGITAIRNNVLNSIKDVIDRITQFIIHDTKSDGVELSAHVFPAPDHAPVQGRQFSNEEFAKMQNGEDFEDVNGNKYRGFPRPIMAWNCRHYVKPIIIGVTPPEHTDKELQKILDDNERGFTTSDGKHYTLYECTQIQRRYERQIREAKSRLSISNALNDNVSANKWNAKVKDLTQQYKTFSKLCGIAPQAYRLRVKDY
jgi:Phage minor capsid protein 2.